MSALSARRWALILAPVIAGLLTIVGVIADPAPAANGRELIEAYAANPAPLNVKAVGYHFAYTLWLFAALALASMVREKSAWLANIAGLLALLGISTIPGFLVSDFIDSAMGRLISVDAAMQVGEAAQQQWGFAVMALPGFAGLLLAFPLAAIAAWRAGLLPWWAVAAVIAGKVAFLGFNVTLPGNILLAVCFAVFTLAAARMDMAGSHAPVVQYGYSPSQ
jgi:hypothetical protein